MHLVDVRAEDPVEIGQEREDPEVPDTDFCELSTLERVQVTNVQVSLRCKLLEGDTATSASGSERVAKPLNSLSQLDKPLVNVISRNFGCRGSLNVLRGERQR